MMSQRKHKNILLFRIGQLGDTILALPAMYAIRKYYPEARITLLSDRHPEKKYVLAKDLLFNTGLFDEFISYDADTGGVNPKKMIALLPKLKQQKFDLLVYLAPRVRTQWQVWRDLLFFRAAGIKKFVGHNGFAALPVKKRGVVLPKVEQEADHLLRRLGMSGISVPAAGEGCTDLGLTLLEKKKAKVFIFTSLENNDATKLVGFGPSSKWLSKIWPRERYAEVGRELISKFNIMPIIIGGGEEKVVGDWLLGQWGVGVNAAGKLSVRESAAVLQKCHLYVGNDTGVMHLASAVETPCVVIFSAQDWPGRWYPYDKRSFVLRKSPPCEGCMMHTCPKKEIICLSQITVAEVVKGCEPLLSHKSSFKKIDGTSCVE